MKRAFLFGGPVNPQNPASRIAVPEPKLQLGLLCGQAVAYPADRLNDEWVRRVGFDLAP